jgi:hypothetical protein
VPVVQVVEIQVGWPPKAQRAGGRLSGAGGSRCLVRSRGASFGKKLQSGSHDGGCERDRCRELHQVGFRKLNEVLEGRRSSLCARDWSPRKNRCRCDPELVIVTERFPVPSNVLFGVDELIHFLVRVSGLGLGPAHLVRASRL